MITAPAIWLGVDLLQPPLSKLWKGENFDNPTSPLSCSSIPLTPLVSHQHPSELNLFQQYRQVTTFLKGTSRATNDGWYSHPLEHDFQLHLRFDGNHFASWTHYLPKGTWAPGPVISSDFITSAELTTTFGKELISLAKSAGASSVGIILHIADEFATAEINPDLDNPAALPELRQTIVSDPKSVLHDNSLPFDEHSWRLVPYSAAGSENIATAVTLSRSFDPFLSLLRDLGNIQNFPIQTLATSAPLIALLTLVELKTSPSHKAFLAVLPYTRFTVLACFNENGDLQLLRTLQHRGQRRPSNLRHAASTTATALEMSSPDIYILPMSGGEDPQLKTDLQSVFPDSDFHEIQWGETPYSIPSLPGIAPEMLAAVRPGPDPELPLASNDTFSSLRNEGWATQDFLPISRQKAEAFPIKAEMRLLRAARYTRFGVLGLVLLGLGWSALELLEMVRKPEWTFQAEEAQVVQGKLKAYNSEKARLEHWDNLLDDRSKAWSTMEMVARLFPEKSGMLLKSMTYTVNPQNTPGASQVGFTKEWKISGLARDEALEKTLADFSTTQGMAAAFSEIARVTGAQCFRSDLSTRNILVNIRTMENSAFRDTPPEEVDDTSETSYPYLFELVITQHFSAEDPLALKVTSAPKSVAQN